MFFEVVLSITLMVALVVIITRLISMKIGDKAKAAQALLMRTLVQEDEAAARLVAYFSQATGTNAYQATAMNIALAADKLLQNIELLYPASCREVVTQFCSLDRTACSTIYKLTGKLGNTIMIQFSWEAVPYLDPKGRVRWLGKSFDIPDYLFGEPERFAYSGSVEVVFPNTITYDHADLLDVIDMIKSCEIEQVKYEAKVERTRVFRMEYRYGSYDVVPYNREISRMPREYLDAAYSEVEVEFEGEQHGLNMSAALDFTTEAIKDKQNVYILGAPGVGKTTLLEQIQARLATDPEMNVNIITITPGIIEELQSVQAQGDFQEALRAFTLYGGINVICIDEAESLLTTEKSGIHSKANTLMLQMLSGSFQKDLNCVCVLIFNARPEQLNQALFRRGRMGVMLDLKPVKAAQSRDLVEQLKVRMPDKAFDAVMFAKILGSVNTLPDGTKYAGVNEISLADIYACFMDRPRRSMLIDLLRAKAGKKPLKDTFKQRTLEEKIKPAPARARRIVAEQAPAELEQEEKLAPKPAIPAKAVPIAKPAAEAKVPVIATKKKKKRRR